MELSPIAATVEPDQRASMVIGLKRWSAGLWALFLGLGAASGARAALNAHTLAGLVIDVVGLGVPIIFYSYRALLGRPVIVIDDQGFTDCRAHRTIAWDEIEFARVETHESVFGVDHSLRLVLTESQDRPTPPRRLITTNTNNDYEIDVSLDGLCLPWEDVVAALEARLGRSAIGAFSRGSRTRNARWLSLLP